MERIKPRGFTLIEVLVSMIIFVVLSAIAYGGLTSILRSREYAEEYLNRLQALQMTFLYLKRDIEQAVLRPIRDELGEELPPLKGGGISGVFLECTRAGWNNPANLPRSTLQRVAYDYTGDKLYRVFWRVLDRAPDTKPVRRSLLEGVKHIEVRFMDNNLQAHDHWPLEDKKETQEAEKLPRAIALRLEMEGMGEFKRLFSLVSR